MDEETPDRRSRKRQLRVEAIVEKAIELVEAGGLEALTIHRLAGELDLAVSALYRYFPSMDALHAEVQRRIVRDYHRALELHLATSASALAKGPAADPVARLFTSALHFRRYFTARRGRMGVIALSMSDPRRLLSDVEITRVMEEVAALLGKVASMFEEAHATRALSPGDTMERTLVFWATLQGVMQMHKMDRFALGGLDHEGLLVSAVRTMLLGYGAEPKKLAAGLRRATALQGGDDGHDGDGSDGGGERPSSAGARRA